MGILSPRISYFKVNTRNFTLTSGLFGASTVKNSPHFCWWCQCTKENGFHINCKVEKIKISFMAKSTFYYRPLCDTTPPRFFDSMGKKSTR